MTFSQRSSPFVRRLRGGRTESLQARATEYARPVRVSFHPRAVAAHVGAESRSVRAFRAWFAGAFVLVWFVSTCFLLGDIGFWNDDYFMAERALLGESGPLHILPAPTPFEPPNPATPFWRPLLTIGVTSLVANSWDHPWIVHLIIACAHAGTALLLYALLRTLGRTHAIAAACCLLYLAWPSHFEVALWANGFLSGVATGAAMACSMLYICWARLGVAASRTHKSCLLVALALAAMVLIASNEQPAGALLGLPLLYLAARPDTFARSASSGREAWHAAMPLAVLALIFVGGIVLVVVSQSGAGAASGFVPVELWPRRWLSMIDAGWRELLLRTQGLAAARLGVDTLLEHPARALATALGTLGVLALCWRWIVRENFVQRALFPIGSSPALRRIALSAAGLFMFVGACLPLAMVDARMRPRMTAILLVAAMVCLAGPVERALAWLVNRFGPLARAVCLLCVASIIALGALSMVGMQRAFQLRWRHDQLIAQALRDRFHDLPADSILMPVRCDDWPVQTGRQRLDASFVGPFYWSFAFPSFTRVALNQPQLSASFVHPDVTLAFAVTPTHALRHGPMPWPNTLESWPPPAAVDDALTTTGWKPRQIPDTARWMPFDRCVPFVTRPDGGIDPITRLVFRKGATEVDGVMLGGEIILDVEISRTTALAHAGRFQPLTWIIDLPAPPKRRKAIESDRSR